MSDFDPAPWLEICRAAVAEIEGILAAMPGRDERERPIGEGKGGDITVAIDEATESAIIRRLDGLDVKIVSEEVGVVGEGRWTVVIDPIDGSQNCERGIPYFCMSLAVADGDTMDDVQFGFVYDFGSREEWVAVKGQGATLNGHAILDLPKPHLQFLSIEATKGTLVLEHLPALAPITDRVRIMGAQALTYCHLSAGRTDGVVCLKPSRPVDIAAAQLIVRERGCTIMLADGGVFGEHPLDLKARSRVVAAGTPEIAAQLAAAINA